MDLTEITHRMFMQANFERQLIERERGKRKSLTEFLHWQLANGCPREIKDNAILGMFSPEFVAKINLLSINRNIFQVLRRDGDVFKLLEHLADIIEDQQAELIKKHELR